MKRVLITGINGLIGSMLHEQLGDRYAISGITRRPVEFPTHIADITDFDAMLPAFEGIDVVVHMAGDPSPSAEWESVYHNNILGTYNVFEAARRAGVDSVIFATTNHTQAMWEVEQGPRIYSPNDDRLLHPSAPFRPDSFYGWSKAAGESLGRYYSDTHGLRVFCLRIGWVMRGDDPDTVDTSGEVVPPIPPEAIRDRGRAIYLSHRDCVELVRCCIDNETVRFGVYFGISDNSGQFYDMTNAREELGYIPQDSAPRR
jgi:nucleoside-diphosphate-sugar epimerase